MNKAINEKKIRSKPNPSNIHNTHYTQIFVPKANGMAKEPYYIYLYKYIYINTC